MKVQLRYVYLRGGTYYWQRRVPLDLLQRYDCKLLKVNLNTLDPQVVIRKVEALNSKVEAEWAAMRNDEHMTPVQARAAALVLLKQHGLQPYPFRNHGATLDHFLDTVVYPKLEAHAAGDEVVYREAAPQEFLSATQVAAVELLNVEPEMTLSEALDIYLSCHKKAHDAKFRAYTTRVWNTLVAALGDKPFMDVSRADVNAYRDKVLAKGNKTTTVRRQVNVLRAVFAVVIREKELTLVKANPFEAVAIAGLGEDSEPREPFTPEQLSIIKKALVEADDDMRHIMGLQADTGMRLGEAVGLALADIKLDAEVPHVVIKHQPWRRVKNDKTQRVVPLVGTSLWAAQRVVATAKPGQLLCFPRYTSATDCRADIASATLNDWIKARGVPRTTHSFRHTLADRLRDVNCPRDVRLSIGGWSGQAIGDNYGHGYALETMRDWLLKIV